jgi:hypothetical protein
MSDTALRLLEGRLRQGGLETYSQPYSALEVLNVNRSAK